MTVDGVTALVRGTDTGALHPDDEAAVRAFVGMLRRKAELRDRPPVPLSPGERVEVSRFDQADPVRGSALNERRPDGTVEALAWDDDLAAAFAAQDLRFRP